MAQDDWITTTEAAEISGYHVEYVRKLIKSDKVKGRKVWGREWQVSRSSLLAHIAKAGKLGAKRGPKPGA
jgi:excisionase family DNA binding protein